MSQRITQIEADQIEKDCCALCCESSCCGECRNAHDAFLADEGKSSVWLVLKQSEAENIVRSAENGQSHRVVLILKGQPWWPELCAKIRRLPYRKVSIS